MWTCKKCANVNYDSSTCMICNTRFKPGVDKEGIVRHHWRFYFWLNVISAIIIGYVLGRIRIRG